MRPSHNCAPSAYNNTRKLPELQLVQHRRGGLLRAAHAGLILQPRLGLVLPLLRLGFRRRILTNGRWGAEEAAAGAPAKKNGIVGYLCLTVVVIVPTCS